MRSRRLVLFRRANSKRIRVGDVERLETRHSMRSVCIEPLRITRSKMRPWECVAAVKEF